MTIQKATELFDSKGLQYQVLQHPRSVTAKETARKSHIADESLTKTVVVRADDRLVMILIPADSSLDIFELAHTLKADCVNLVSEPELATLFPNCELGAFPPLGNVYGMPVYLAKELYERLEITFNSETHTELIRMNTVDFCQMVDAKRIEKGYQRTNTRISLYEQVSQPWSWI